MIRRFAPLVLLLVLSEGTFGQRPDGQLHFTWVDGKLSLQVLGDSDDEWRLSVSEDLETWTEDPTLGSLILSGKAESAPRFELDPAAHRQRFFRIDKTKGLYDDSVLRTVNLRFRQRNWQSLLTSNYSSGTNLIGDLTLGNGIEIQSVGVRYRGNTSYSRSGIKKSVNIEVDATDPQADVLGYDTMNLNNAFTDDTIMREPIYFNVMRRYAPCPRATFAKLYINDEFWGVYSFVQQEDGRLANQWFPTRRGDRWRAPNIAISGGFAGGGSAFTFLGSSQSEYERNYELKYSLNSGLAWRRLIRATTVLNNTPSHRLKEAVDSLFAVDSWLWFLAVENIFADDDSYFHKGADYAFYFEPKTGRFFPIERDGNEAFFQPDVNLSPIDGFGNPNRPLINRLLSIPEYRQRYLAHMRTVLEERFNSDYMDAIIDRHLALIAESVRQDTKKPFSFTAFRSAVAELRSFVRRRHSYLSSHGELRPIAPEFVAVSEPEPPMAGSAVTITAEIDGAASNGIHSAWLYYAQGPMGRYTRMQMTPLGDGHFEATIPGLLAGKIDYYVEARAGNTAKAARFWPRRAEREPRSFRVLASDPSSTPGVRINKFMAINESTLADPQGEFDDWIELKNLTSTPYDLTGHFLSDNPNNARKWQFPNDTLIPANGVLLVWADEDGEDSPGLHANFKLAGDGEEILLTGPEGENNPLLDWVTYPLQFPDETYELSEPE